MRLFLRDNWLNSLYINLGSSILIIVFIDFLVQKRNSEENDERLARIEKNLMRLRI